MEIQVSAAPMNSNEFDWVIMDHICQNGMENLDWKAMYPADFGFQALIIFKANGFNNVHRNISFVSPFRTEPIHNPEVTPVSKRAFTEPKPSDDESKCDYGCSNRSSRPTDSQARQAVTTDALDTSMDSTHRLTLTDSKKQVRPTEIVNGLTQNTTKNLQPNLLKSACKSKHICKPLWLKYLQMQSTSRLIQNIRENSFTEKSTKYWRLQTRV
ncbi:uncharacterized protein [Palaemon carinicauda]|uniref:uncharacterized protein n=1 Tax=Palaemon carinicauda TaxID=392227 RepID=UPI0035B633BE